MSKQKIRQSDLANMTWESLGVSRKDDALKFTRNLFSHMVNELLKGNDVYIKGLGTFKTYMREPYESVTPWDGIKYQTKKTRKVKFNLSRQLKIKLGELEM